MKKEKSSKKWLIISIVLFITIALSTIIIALLSFNFPGIIKIYSDEYKYRADATISESAEIKDIDTIDINCDIADLIIEPYKGNTASIEYIAKEDSQIKLKSVNGKLTIDAIYGKGPKLDPNFLHNNNIKLIIKLPENYNKELNVDDNVGDIKLNGSFTKAKLNADVGDIDAQVDADYLNVTCSVGDAEVTGNINSSNIETAVGNIHYKPMLSKKGEHALKSDVGSIDLDLDEDSNVSVKASTNLGDINNKFNFTSITKDDKKDLASSFAAYNKDGESTINLDSDSGEITIE